VTLVVCFAVLASFVVDVQAQDTIAEIRVHGNHTTPSDDVLAIAALRVGEPADAERLAQAERALRESGRFENAEVRRRYRSIDNPSEILIVIMVDERAPLRPMWLPIVAKREGHALTFGARVALVDVLPRTRIAAPLTWGGERRAAVEIEHTVGSTDTVGATHASPVRIHAAFGVQRTINPHFDVADERRDVRLQAERAFAPWLRAGAGARVTEVEFGGPAERQHAFSAHAVIDTRADPAFPRNAIHATFAMSRLKPAPTTELRAAPTTELRAAPTTELRAAPTTDLRTAPTTGLTAALTYTVDARGYVGLVGPAVLALRAQAVHARAPLPRHEWTLLGGGESLRGHRAGYRAGDNMAALSTELRVPVLSPLDTARVGVQAFVDTGAAWAADQPLRRQRFDHGYGAGVFANAWGVTANADFAWPAKRVHASLGVVF
jgi:hypothetical protein